MPVKFTEAFKINPLVLKELGVFDAILDVDTRVFFDPALISLTTAPEFIGAKEKIEQYCSDDKQSSKQKRAWSKELKSFTTRITKMIQ